MKIKYYLINLALITVLILTYVFYQNIDSKDESQISENTSFEDEILALKDQVTASQENMSVQIEKTSNTDKVPKELVTVMLEKTSKQYYHGFLTANGKFK